MLTGFQLGAQAAGLSERLVCLLGALQPGVDVAFARLELLDRAARPGARSLDASRDVGVARGAFPVRGQGAVARVFGGGKDGIRDGIMGARRGRGVIERAAHRARGFVGEVGGKLGREP